MRTLNEYARDVAEANGGKVEFVGRNYAVVIAHDPRRREVVIPGPGAGRNWRNLARAELRRERDRAAANK